MAKSVNPLLLALVEQSGGFVPRVFQRMEISLEIFRERLVQELKKSRNTVLPHPGYLAADCHL
jgi:hypothetical protein